MRIKKILIIDDSPVARMLMKKCIGDGYEIYEAGSGEEGLALFKSTSVDLTFLDLTMPGMNGMDVLKEMIKRETTVKVIIVSADRQLATIKQALEYGAFTVLRKPPRQEIIKQTIEAARAGIKPEVEGL